MDLPQEQLQFLTMAQILKETITIPTKSPQTFFLITLTLILPLSLAIFANSVFTFPLYLLTDLSSHPIKFLFIYEIYHIIIIVLAILSTSAVVFISASIYTSKPVSFLSTMSALPNLSIRLFKTFICISFLLSVYNLILFLFYNLAVMAGAGEVDCSLLTVIVIIFTGMAVFQIQVYFTGLCFMASAVSVLEPVNGFSAFKKSYHLMKGKILMLYLFMDFYMLLSILVIWVSGILVFFDGYEFSVVFKIAFSGLMVGLLVVLNLGGLVMISVFYYVCKSYHCETIDKTALFDHLGGYLGEYVPLMSSSSSDGTIQMKTLNI